MNTQIVYSVVSGRNDIYLSQAFVSIYTARMHNPTASIILVVEKETNGIIKSQLSSIINLISEIKEVFVPSSLSKKEKSRYLKTLLREVVVGDFLFIDTDTVITCDLSEIDDVKIDIAAVPDRHSPVCSHPLKDNIVRDIAPMGVSIEDLRDYYFNSGVMYVKDSPIAHKLYSVWHQEWDKGLKKGISIDQPSLALANKICNYPIKVLSGIWNCQLVDNFINYLSDAKILHYFASNKKSPYKLYNNQIFLDILRNNDIPLWIKEKMVNPKKFFIENHVIAYGDDMLFLKTYTYTMFRYHRRFFALIEYISRVITTKRF